MSSICKTLLKVLLLLVPPMAAWQAGEGQRAEANGTLRPGRVQLLAQRLQVAKSGSAHQALARPPKQGGTTQVDQGAVTQGAALTFRLWGVTVRLRG